VKIIQEELKGFPTFRGDLIIPFSKV